MKPARRPPEEPLDERLLVVDPRSGAVGHARLRDLPGLLRAGDLLVVNDAATLPASLAGRTETGAEVEVRLAGELAGVAWRAVLFGAGDWRTPTEHRAAPEPLAAGARISFAERAPAPEAAAAVAGISSVERTPGPEAAEAGAQRPSGAALGATVERVSPAHARLVELRFDRRGAALWSALYRLGRPVQYSYLEAPLHLWSVQTPWAARPWAVEAPSAGLPLRWELLVALARRGVRVASITHAAGLSSTGDPALDAALPLPERFEIPGATVEAIRAARAAGARVVAVGTTVVRALEGAAALHGGALVPGEGVTDLVVRRDYRPRVVDGLLTGIHEPAASHYELLHAFAPPELVARAWAEAEARDYQGHEFGDASLILGAPRG